MNNPRFQSRFSVAGKPARDNDFKSKGLLLQRLNKWIAVAKVLSNPKRTTVTSELKGLRDDAQGLLLDLGRWAPLDALRDIEDLSFHVSKGRSQRQCYENLSKMVELLEAARQSLVVGRGTSGKRVSPEGIERKRAIRELYEKYKGQSCYIQKICAGLQERRVKMLDRWIRLLWGLEPRDRYEPWEWARAYEDRRMRRTLQRFISKSSVAVAKLFHRRVATTPLLTDSRSSL
jgi:hypothetical protein